MSSKFRRIVKDDSKTRHRSNANSNVHSNIFLIFRMKETNVRDEGSRANSTFSDVDSGTKIEAVAFVGSARAQPKIIIIIVSCENRVLAIPSEASVQPVSNRQPCIPCSPTKEPRPSTPAEGATARGTSDRDLPPMFQSLPTVFVDCESDSPTEIQHVKKAPFSRNLPVYASWSNFNRFQPWTDIVPSISDSLRSFQQHEESCLLADDPPPTGAHVGGSFTRVRALVYPAGSAAIVGIRILISPPTAPAHQARGKGQRKFLDWKPDQIDSNMVRQNAHAIKAVAIPLSKPRAVGAANRITASRETAAKTRKTSARAQTIPVESAPALQGTSTNSDVLTRRMRNASVSVSLRKKYSAILERVIKTLGCGNGRSTVSILQLNWDNNNAVNFSKFSVHDAIEEPRYRRPSVSARTSNCRKPAIAANQKMEPSPSCVNRHQATSRKPYSHDVEKCYVHGPPPETKPTLPGAVNGPVPSSSNSGAPTHSKSVEHALLQQLGQWRAARFGLRNRTDPHITSTASRSSAFSTANGLSAQFQSTVSVTVPEHVDFSAIHPGPPPPVVERSFMDDPKLFLSNHVLNDNVRKATKFATAKTSASMHGFIVPWFNEDHVSASLVQRPSTPTPAETGRRPSTSSEEYSTVPYHLGSSGREAVPVGFMDYRGVELASAACAGDEIPVKRRHGTNEVRFVVPDPHDVVRSGGTASQSHNGTQPHPLQSANRTNPTVTGHAIRVPDLASRAQQPNDALSTPVHTSSVDVPRSSVYKTNRRKQRDELARQNRIRMKEFDQRFGLRDLVIENYFRFANTYTILSCYRTILACATFKMREPLNMLSTLKSQKKIQTIWSTLNTESPLSPNSDGESSDDDAAARRRFRMERQRTGAVRTKAFGQEGNFVSNPEQPNGSSSLVNSSEYSSTTDCIDGTLQDASFRTRCSLMTHAWVLKRICLSCDKLVRGSSTGGSPLFSCDCNVASGASSNSRARCSSSPQLNWPVDLINCKWAPSVGSVSLTYLSDRNRWRDIPSSPGKIQLNHWCRLAKNTVGNPKSPKTWTVAVYMASYRQPTLSTGHRQFIIARIAIQHTNQFLQCKLHRRILDRDVVNVACCREGRTRKRIRPDVEPFRCLTAVPSQKKHGG
ncbi:hypothetical protein CLF_111108 [Clonorchis sinensis]|uniref:Uncharacterized protein n=1 Tax=Clonorchis sinensis TaxID=79923 RepID=G7YUD3_CLOSI|nr:hypothetical protein CLF_111108 [Clonorchis sinensis]